MKRDILNYHIKSDSHLTKGDIFKRTFWNVLVFRIEICVRSRSQKKLFLYEKWHTYGQNMKSEKGNGLHLYYSSTIIVHPFEMKSTNAFLATHLNLKIRQFDQINSMCGFNSSLQIQKKKNLLYQR